jgi:hypothetical protein
MAAQATLHCLAGCAIGEVLGMVIGTALGWSAAVTVALAVVLGCRTPAGVCGTPVGQSPRPSSTPGVSSSNERQTPGRTEDLLDRYRVLCRWLTAQGHDLGPLAEEFDTQQESQRRR